MVLLREAVGQTLRAARTSQGRMDNLRHLCRLETLFPYIGA